ncbi:hypothetical protein ES705_19608 [subsurface metagenome]
MECYEVVKRRETIKKATVRATLRALAINSHSYQWSVSTLQADFIKYMLNIHN